MKIINEALLNETTGRAKQSPRLRMNYNFHEHLDDPVNRLLNALEPGTYLRPHRHLNPKKDEIFLLLRGRIAVFLFDNKGEITQTQILDPKEGVYGAEIKAGTWHERGGKIYGVIRKGNITLHYLPVPLKENFSFMQGKLYFHRDETSFSSP